MEKHQTTPEHKYLAEIVQLTRAVFELIRRTPQENKGQLELAKVAAAKLGSIVDRYEEKLHPDLGQDLVEYVMLKLEDDGTDPSGWVNMYERDTDRMLRELEIEYGLNSSE